MTAWFAAIFMLLGAAFMLLAAIGVWRLPDVLTRMQAATKAGTLGVVCLLTSEAIHYADTRVTAHAVVIILFFFLTSPIAAHRIARAAHRVGVPLWEGTHRDELRETSARAARSPAAEDVGVSARHRERQSPPT